MDPGRRPATRRRGGAAGTGPGRTGRAALMVRWCCGPRSRPSDAGLLSLLAGAAMAEAIGGVGGAAVRCKWPNDLMAGDDKVGGILAEAWSRATVSRRGDRARGSTSRPPRGRRRRRVGADVDVDGLADARSSRRFRRRLPPGAAGVRRRRDRAMDATRRRRSGRQVGGGRRPPALRVEGVRGGRWTRRGGLVMETRRRIARTVTSDEVVHLALSLVAATRGRR